MMRAAQPLAPGFGGVTRTGPSFPEMTALIVKFPLDVFLIWADFTAPFSPLESLYFKPLTASPLQKGLHVTPLVPCGRLNVCGTPERMGPFATTVSDPPVH